MFSHEDIYMRPVEASDLEQIRQLRNNEQTWMYLSDASLISEGMQSKWFDNLTRTLDERYYAVLRAKDDKFIGIIRTDCIDLRNKNMRVGADVSLDCRNQGYGTKIFKMLLRYFFDYCGNYHKLYLMVLEDNEIAKRLYKNMGFKEEGKMREHIWRDAAWKGYVIMSILEDEYRSQNAL